MFKKTLALATFSAVAVAGVGVTDVQARDQINIVGSSTVFPFAITVAERFGKTSKFEAPKIESTGSGGGLKLFCAGIGDQHPDITNASRRIKESEVERCKKNGVEEIVEVKIGYDGIVIANSKKAGKVELTLRDVYLALAKDVPDGEGKWKPNPHKTWKDVNPSLPAKKIEVLGPPPTSGTRDAFAELALEGGCKTFDWVKALKKQDKNAYKARCHTVREDGAYIERGENDNAIVQELVANPDAFGVFGFSFLDQNRNKLQGSAANGNAPTFENIASGAYPVSRALYFYVKKAHIGKKPGIKAYVDEFMSDKATGSDGYLVDKGLIPLGGSERAQWKKRVDQLANLDMSIK